jgi:hypothetical protein
MSGDATSDTILALLAKRRPGATICPSEVARRIWPSDGADWRAAMPIVHAAVDRLLDQKRVVLSWKGSAMPDRTGPYRIGLPDGTGRRSQHAQGSGKADGSDPAD